MPPLINSLDEVPASQNWIQWKSWSVKYYSTNNDDCVSNWVCICWKKEKEKSEWKSTERETWLDRESEEARRRSCDVNPMAIAQLNIQFSAEINAFLHSTSSQPQRGLLLNCRVVKIEFDNLVLVEPSKWFHPSHVSREPGPKGWNEIKDRIFIFFYRKESTSL